jgi:hypothetical protein
MRTTDSSLVPLDATEPCGPNLEYDQGLPSLDNLATAAAERTIDSTVKQASGRGGRKVLRQAEQLIGRMRDVRVPIRWAHARLKSSGSRALECHRWADRGPTSALVVRHRNDARPSCNTP